GLSFSLSSQGQVLHTAQPDLSFRDPMGVAELGQVQFKVRRCNRLNQLLGAQRRHEAVSGRSARGFANGGRREVIYQTQTHLSFRGPMGVASVLDVVFQSSFVSV